MATGTVKAVNIGRGFFFITPSEPGARDVFAHVRDMRDQTLFDEQLVGMRMTYELSDDRGGRIRAVDIRAAR